MVLRIDEVAGPNGEEKQESVEKEIKKWGRFSPADKPADGELIIVCAKFMESGGRYMEGTCNPMRIH